MTIVRRNSGSRRKGFKEVEKRNSENKTAKEKTYQLSDECCICLEEFGTDLEVLTYCYTACGQIYHMMCLSGWLKGQKKTNQRCPNCREFLDHNKLLHPGPSRMKSLQERIADIAGVSISKVARGSLYTGTSGDTDKSLTELLKSAGLSDSQEGDDVSTGSVDLEKAFELRSLNLDKLT